MRLIWVSVVVTSVSARLSLHAQECDPEGFASRPTDEQRAINKAFADEPRLEEMRVVLRAPRAAVRTKLIAAMLSCRIPIAHSSDDVIEAQYGEHSGGFGNYDIKTRAYIVALDDSSTLVRLAGQETSKRGRALNPTINTTAITNKNQGRSREAWIALRNVAKQLRADTTLRVDMEQSTPLNLKFTP